MFNINDFVYIIPTGDPAIDAFLDQQMKIVRIELTQADRWTSFDSYTLQSKDGQEITVLDCEMEYHNA